MPLPLPRPSNQSGGFFDGLIDKVTNTFDGLVDLGLGALEFKLAESLISSDLATNENFGGPQAPMVTATTPQVSSSLNDMLPMIAIAGGLALVVVLLVKK